jgi:hypothetical protein
LARWFQPTVHPRCLHLGDGSASSPCSAGLNCHGLGAGLVPHRDVAWRRVEGVAGLEDLVAVGEANRSSCR